MIEYWNSFWFQGDNLVNFGIARFLIVFYLLFVKLNHSNYDLNAWVRARKSLLNYWQNPWLLKKIKIGYFGETAEFALVKLFKFTLFLTMIGFCTPISAFVGLIIGLYILGLRHGIKMHHPLIPFHFVMLILFIAPSGASFSIDHLIGLNFYPSDLIVPLSNWGYQMLRVVICIVIFATGLAKIRHFSLNGGFVKTGNLSALMRLHDFSYFYAHPKVSISKYVQRYPMLEFAGIWSTVILELFFPAVLFSSMVAAVMVPAFMALVLSFRLFLGPRFDFFNAYLLAVFFPWDKFY